MYVENNTETNRFYEIEAIVDKRVRKFQKTSITQYKVKLLNYDLKFDE